MTKNEIMEKLDELEIEYNPNALKADLEALLPVEEPEVEVEEPEVEVEEPEVEVEDEPVIVDKKGEYAGKKIIDIYIKKIDGGQGSKKVKILVLEGGEEVPVSED